MKLTFFGTKLIVTTAVFLIITLLVFTSCVETNDTSEQSSSQTSMRPDLISESNSNTSSNASSQAKSTSETVPEYIDTTFSTNTFIKYCNASDEPGFESVYKFDKEGKMTYSYNMCEGFVQATDRYFIREYRNGKYQIMTYTESIDTPKVLFTVFNDKDISADAAASFINEQEFNQTYAFHTEWNKQAVEYEAE
jgi:hypothetical protein